MQVLIYRPSLTLVGDAPERLGAEPVVLEHDGTLATRDGSPMPDARPEAAWYSRELILTPGAPGGRFFKTVHRSGTRWVHSAAAGWEHPVFRGLLDAGIRLTVNDASSIAIAEYVLGEVLAAFQPLAERRLAQARREWQRFDFRELHGSRWLIVGYGHIGREVARRARAFGATVTGIRRRPIADAFAHRVLPASALLEEATTADVIVVSAAANPDNTHLIDAEVLEQLRPESILVNVARGSLIDTDALRASLDRGRPARAVLDVFETEPLPADDPLWAHPRVRVTAHCAASGDGTGPRGVDVFLEHLDAWRAGRPLRLEVSPPRDSQGA